MTYKLNPELRKIQSPVVLVFPSGETRKYECGYAVAEVDYEFYHKITRLARGMATVAILGAASERHNVAKRDSMSRGGVVPGMAWHLLDMNRRYRT